MVYGSLLAPSHGLQWLLERQPGQRKQSQRREHDEKSLYLVNFSFHRARYLPILFLDL